MYEANKIIDGLFQGGFPPYGDGLKNAGVDVLVLCAKENQDFEKYEGLTVICAPGDDDIRFHRMMRDLKVWRPAAENVVEHVKASKKVLVTCMAGLNRSGLVIALALRELTGWSGTKIVEHIQSCRPQALCNSTFEKFVIDSYPEES
jgi:protein-tyrosine phosphatase